MQLAIGLVSLLICVLAIAAMLLPDIHDAFRRRNPYRRFRDYPGWFRPAAFGILVAAGCVVFWTLKQV